MKLYIVEDDPIVHKELDEKLKLLGYNDNQFFTNVADVKELIKQIRPDIMIVDIELGAAENGIELGHWLDEQSIPYFFLSGKQDTTTFVKTDSTRAYTNIEKPISLATLRNVLHATLKKADERPSNKPFVFLTIADYEHKVMIEDIEYLKAARSYCDLKRVGKQKTDLISMPLQSLMEKLNHSSLIRVHRSFAVNIKHVVKRSGNVLFVGNETDFAKIDLGKTYKSHFEKAINS